MKMVLRFTVWGLFAGLFFMQTTLLAQDKPNVHDITSSSNNTKNSEIEFPEIDGWEKGDIRKFPSAALGYSIAYQSDEGGIVTIYVYNGGQSKIPNDINDKILKNEIAKAKSEIVEAGKAGYYDNVREIKSDVITLGGADGKVKSLYTLFNFTMRGTEVDSEIYLFGYQNNFIKIRATRPKAAKNTENKVFTSFLAQIDKMFSN